MRGAFEDQGGLFSYISPEARIPASHPLRKIRELVREVLGELNAWEAVVLPLNYARETLISSAFLEARLEFCPSLVRHTDPPAHRPEAPDKFVCRYSKHSHTMTTG